MIKQDWKRLETLSRLFLNKLVAPLLWHDCFHREFLLGVYHTDVRIHTHCSTSPHLADIYFTFVKFYTTPMFSTITVALIQQQYLWLCHCNFHLIPTATLLIYISLQSFLHFHHSHIPYPETLRVLDICYMLISQCG